MFQWLKWQFNFIYPYMYADTLIVYLVLNVSVACQEGKYRDNTMKTCQTCPVGKEPNDDKAACGKKQFCLQLS